MYSTKNLQRKAWPIKLGEGGGGGLDPHLLHQPMETIPHVLLPTLSSHQGDIIHSFSIRNLDKIIDPSPEGLHLVDLDSARSFANIIVNVCEQGFTPLTCIQPFSAHLEHSR